jgi:hypothetical protein
MHIFTANVKGYIHIFTAIIDGKMHIFTPNPTKIHTGLTHSSEVFPQDQEDNSQTY